MVPLSHELEEYAKDIVGVMRPRRGLRVELHAHHRPVPQSHPLHRAVIKASAKLAAVAKALKPVLTSGFGLETLPGWIGRWTQRAAASLQITQTGQLNWNIVGIPAAVVVVLVVLMSYR